MRNLGITLSAVFIFVGGLGCAGMKPTLFVHDEFNFDFLERVAVIPFDNLSKDQGAGARASRIFISELLAAEVFDVLEPGEVSRVLENHSIIRSDALNMEQIVTVGKEMGVQAVFLGAVTESTLMRGGSSAGITVTIVARMVETEMGMTVWSATHTTGNRSFWSSLFGTGKKSHSEVMRSCVEKILKTLVD